MNTIISTESFPPSESIRTETRRPLQMLVVEDDLPSKLLIQRFLARYSTSITFTDDPIYAMKLLQNCTFDIVWLDIILPGLSGIELTHIIREQDAVYHEPYIVALTALAFRQAKTKCLDVGMNDFVAKPFTRKDLADAISRYLKRCKDSPCEESYR